MSNYARHIYPRLLSGDTTRFYLPSTGIAAISPAFDAGWEETSTADRVEMHTTKISSAMTSQSVTTLITAGDALCRQFVSRPLQAQAISGAVRVYARTVETLGTVDALSRVVLKVVSNDGSTVRGTLLSINDYSTGAEWNTSLRNKAFANGDTPTLVNASDGDRLVLEMGFNHAAVISSASISFGDDSATDLAEDETTTTANNPWLEIAQAMTFKAETFSVSMGGTLTTAGALVKSVGKSLSGTLTSTGSLVKVTSTHLAGTLTLAGALVKISSKVIGGTLTSSGSLVVKSVAQHLSGTLSLTGSLTKSVATSYAGILAPVGQVIKNIIKGAFGGILTPSGELTTAFPGPAVVITEYAVMQPALSADIRQDTLGLQVELVELEAVVAQDELDWTVNRG